VDWVDHAALEFGQPRPVLRPLAWPDRTSAISAYVSGLSAAMIGGLI
jgi:hypothetical protein